MEKHLNDLKAAMMEGKTLAAHDALSSAMREYHKMRLSGLENDAKRMIGPA